MGYSYKFKDLDFDFSDKNYISHWDFMLSEFFNASPRVKDRFCEAYLKEYGVGAYNHMIRKFWYDWKMGSRVVSDTQSYRIYCLMPSLLDDSALHRLGLNEFMMSIKGTVKGFLQDQKKSYGRNSQVHKTVELVQMFENELDKIRSLELVDIGTLVLTQAEKDEALEISRYILEIKLQNSFDQIETDLNMILPHVLQFNRGVCKSFYSMDVFNLKLDLSKIESENLEVPKFRIKEIESNTSYKEYSDKYLAYELISIHNDACTAVCNAFLNGNDLALFFSHYEQLLNGENVVSMKSTFQGEGGILLLEAHLKPIKLLRESIILSALKLVLYFGVIITLSILALANELYTLLIFGGFFVVSFIFGVISDEVKNIVEVSKEWKSYGK